ncbi:MAG: VCBS repeat-containing protein [Deltaproteobacteria bacterium]|nr:VCBS repeat-containing protein [Deltaproteobacteria bacterium]
MPRTIRGLAALSALVALFSALSAAAQPLKVAILPFDVNAQQDMDFLAKGVMDMLSSRLGASGEARVADRSRVLSLMKDEPGPITPERAADLARRLDADRVVWGSITVFGGQVSIDALVARADGGDPVPVYVQAQDMDRVILGVDELAAKIREKILAASAAPPEAPAASAPGGAGETPVDPGDTASPGAGISGAPQEDFWRSPPMNLELVGVAVADFDGDGQNEVAAADAHSVWVKRFTRGRLVNLAKVPGPAWRTIVWVDAADVNGDGRAEILVSAVGRDRRPDSFVLEFDGKSWVPVVEDSPWHIQALEDDEGNARLVGRRGGVTDIFTGGLYRLSVEGARLKKQKELPLPADAMVYGLARAELEGQIMFLSMDEHDYLRVYSSSGEEVWKSDKPWGGTEKRLESPAEEGTTQYVPNRVEALSDGRVLVVENEGLTGRVFSRYRRFSSAVIQCLRWDGLGMVEQWKTGKISGYVPDFGVADLDNDANPELFCAVVQGRDNVGTSGKSFLIFYEFGKLKE